VFTLKSIRK